MNYPAHPATYKDHFNPDIGLREALAALYDDRWLAPVRCYMSFGPYLTVLAVNENNPMHAVLHEGPIYIEDLIDREEPINKLHEWYEFKDETRVRDFLRKNPFLSDLLERAHHRIREHFDPDTRLALEVVKEPDAKDGRRLFVLIYTALRPKEAVARLDELDREWWLGALSEARSKLSIDIEYG